MTEYVNKTGTAKGSVFKDLKKIFIGRAEVRGFIFTQIKFSKCAYLYQVNSGGDIYYEVFKRKQNIRFGNISYPTSFAFGRWAWTYRELEMAEAKFEDINKRKGFEND